MKNLSIEELKEKQAKELQDLIKKQDHQNFIASLFPDLKHLAFSGSVKFDLTNTELKDIAKIVKEIVKKLKPTKNTVLGFAGRKDERTYSPYRVTIENPCKPNQYHNFSASIGYISNDISVTIKLPIEYYKGVLQTRSRKVASFERNYFVGMSDRAFYNHTVREYSFSFSFEYDSVSYSGGNKVAYLKDKTAKTKYKNFVLNGAK